MKNYYEILEVDRNASNEIIKVAYKLLVKKNHPDLKEGTEKAIAEEKIKQINEAYDILSDPIKREEYDSNFLGNATSADDYNNLLMENANLKNELNYYKNLIFEMNSNYTTSSDKQNNYSTYHNVNGAKYNQSNDPFNSSLNKNYTSILDFLKNKIFSNYSENLKSIIALLLTFLFIFIVFKMPFFSDLLQNIFNSGYIFFIIIIILIYVYFFKNKK